MQDEDWRKIKTTEIIHTERYTYLDLLSNTIFLRDITLLFWATKMKMNSFAVSITSSRLLLSCYIKENWHINYTSKGFVRDRQTMSTTK